MVASERASAGLQAKSEVKQLTSKLQNREMEPQPGRTLMESFEAGVNQVRSLQRFLSPFLWLVLSRACGFLSHVSLFMQGTGPILVAFSKCAGHCWQGQVQALLGSSQTSSLEPQDFMIPCACAVSDQLPLCVQVLNKARDDAGKQAQTSLRDTNNVVRMVTAGSKGSFINISQARARQSISALLCVCQLLLAAQCRGLEGRQLSWLDCNCGQGSGESRYVSVFSRFGCTRQLVQCCGINFYLCGADAPCISKFR